MIVVYKHLWHKSHRTVVDVDSGCIEFYSYEHDTRRYNTYIQNRTAEITAIQGVDVMHLPFMIYLREDLDYDITH